MVWFRTLCWFLPRQNGSHTVQSSVRVLIYSQYLLLLSIKCAEGFSQFSPFYRIQSLLKYLVRLTPKKHRKTRNQEVMGKTLNQRQKTDEFTGEQKARRSQTQAGSVERDQSKVENWRVLHGCEEQSGTELVWVSILNTGLMGMRIRWKDTWTWLEKHWLGRWMDQWNGSR